MWHGGGVCRHEGHPNPADEVAQAFEPVRVQLGKTVHEVFEATHASGNSSQKHGSGRISSEKLLFK